MQKSRSCNFIVYLAMQSNFRFFGDEQQLQQWHLLWSLTLTTNNSKNLACLKWQSVCLCCNEHDTACPNFWQTCFTLHVTMWMSTFSWHSMSENVGVQCKWLKMAGGFCRFESKWDEEWIAQLFLFVHHGFLKKKGDLFSQIRGHPPL